MQRERLGSRLGFILLSVGCAVGLGNVWKFPWLVGQNGGGIFVLIYLVCLALIGIPVLTMEFALGRAAQKSPAKMYQQLEPKGSKWHLHGVASVAGCVILMMYYTCVAGWMLYYCWGMAVGKFAGLDKTGNAEAFAQFTGDPVLMVSLTLLVILLGALVCSFSLQGGLERITKYMMGALLLLMLFLAGYACFQPGGAEGLAFYLKPDFNKMKEVGIIKVIVNAMNQAFFTLSIGMGSMAIFGSYLNKDRALLGEAVNVGVLDTSVAFCAGLIIFPTCFAFGIQVDSGPNLLFITLSTAFNGLKGGQIIGTLFFLFMSFAALSTVFAVFECILASVCDLFKVGRKKASLFTGMALAVLAMPCALGFNLWSGFQPFGAGSNVQSLEDFLVSNIVLPLGSFVMLIFCTRKKAWGWPAFKAEANTGKGLKLADWMRGYLTYVLPILIFLVFAIGIYDFFK